MTRTFLFDAFTIIMILAAIGFVVAGIFLSVKILKIGKHGTINSEILVYRVIIATITLEIGISAMLEGQLFRTPDSFYHLFANIVIAAIIGGFGKKEAKETGEAKEEKTGKKKEAHH